MKLFGYEIKKPQRRSFNAAKVNRLTWDWATSVIQINDDIKSNLQTLKVRSREMSKNNNYFRKYLSMCERNIVGPNGIELQMKVTEPDGNYDKIANDIIESNWYRWCRRKNCDIAGQLSFLDLQKLIVRSWKVDGEAFIRKHKTNKGYRFALQVIDSLACDIDYNTILQNGNRVIMGVEVTDEYMPVNYFFKTRQNDTTFKNGATGFNLIRIPADEIIHIFKREFPGQVRGFPVSCSAMMAMNNLNGYSEAELIASRISACKMGFFEESNNMGAPIDDETATQLLTEASPGKFERLPPGVTFKDFDPKHPQGNYPSFVMAQLREIAGGLDVSYNALASDLTSVNFSSMRSGSLEERDAWRMDQTTLIELLCEPSFEEWLVMFLTFGNSNLPMSKFEKFHQDTWKPRTWQWVDPQVDSNTNITLMNQGLKPPQKIAAEMGDDLEDVYAAIAQSNKLKEKYGIVTFTPGQTFPVDTPTKEKDTTDGK